ncbi:MAG: sulfite exporter TauE/SafE family protein [Spirochaetaceae bacterium]|jgi:hypothetical protein|nr:sulfite exporter TauE/SafE family protein [Spirochaetaceae bacterium]
MTNIIGLIPYSLDVRQWAAVIVGCICFGISKTGFNGVSVIAVPLFALVFGAKESTGLALPLICFADLFAVVYYRRHAEWKYIWPLIPWVLAGFALALGVDYFIRTSRGFKFLIGACVIAGLVVMVWNELRGRKDAGPPGGLWAPAFFGVLGGFSTMIGNAAGPIMSVFLLSVRLPKESFVGTAAWFFLIVNYLKIPLQALVWRNISGRTLWLDLYLVPFILLGVGLGILFVKGVNNNQYRVVTYALTFISAALLFL